MSSDGDIVTTGVDSLIKILRKKGKVSMDAISHELRVSEKLLQQWVDFLVEEKIIGIEYKFVTPYIYLLETSHDSLDIKKEFMEKAAKRNLSSEKTSELWAKYVQNHLESIKEQFYDTALQRGIKPPKLDELWIKYRRLLLSNEH